jgi:dipeptidyl aminopeptidase/acylaminoacyl peptidase
MSEFELVPGPRLIRLEARLADRLRGLRRQRRRTEDFSFTSSVGYRIRAVLYLPEGEGPFPAVVLCQDGTDGADDRGVIDGEEIAGVGAACVVFDAAGRGQSWGDEDQGGPEHQDEVAQAARLLAARPDIDANRVGLVGLGLGAVMAIGAAARCGAPVSWVLDWEGPSDRETANVEGDDHYWQDREPVHQVGALRCGYVRLQSEDDHALPGEVRHGVRMGYAAAAGDLPWFQVNQHPRGVAPDRPRWIASGRLAANLAIRKKIKTLCHEQRRRT